VRFVSTTQRDKTFVPVNSAAVRLGVPAAWLRAEVEAGRIPHLKTGRRIMLNPATVEQALLDRARQGAEAPEVANA
jgi:excisionase family DNA binding protein